MPKVVLTEDERAERKEQIKTHVKNLGDRMDELLWGDPKRLAWMKRIDPLFFDEFAEKWKDLEVRYALYLDGQIPWEDWNIISTGPDLRDARLVVGPDIASTGREIFCFVAMRVAVVR